MQMTSVRLGGLLAAVGGLLSAAVMVFSPGIGGDLTQQLADVAHSDALVATNLLDLFATLLIVVGVLAVLQVLAADPQGEPFAVAARPLVVIVGAIALIGDALSLVPYRLIAENYALSTDANRQSVLDSAFSMNATLFAFGALESLLLAGLIPVLVGSAILRTRLFPQWLAFAALAGGAVEIVLSVLALLPANTPDLSILDMIARLLIAATLVAAGFLMWRGEGTASRP
ncbi:MAG TPA: DUF4386 family protein [Actinoplanes sp.]|jgi:hypothetical protein